MGYTTEETNITSCTVKAITNNLGQYNAAIIGRADNNGNWDASVVNILLSHVTATCSVSADGAGPGYSPLF